MIKLAGLNCITLSPSQLQPGRWKKTHFILITATSPIAHDVSVAEFSKSSARYLETNCMNDSTV